MRSVSGRLTVLEQRVIFGAQRLVGEGLVGLSELGRLGRGDFLKLFAEMLNLVGVVLGDLAPEGALDLVDRRRRGDVEHLVVGLHSPRSLSAIS